MNILMYDMGSYIQKDLIYYFRKTGHTCHNILYKCIDRYHDDFFVREFTKLLSEDNYDFVFSTNFFPLLAKICHHQGIKYLSWSYDSPIDISHIEYYQYPTNYAFFFDRLDVQRLQAAGGVHIYHLPLAVCTERLEQTINNAMTKDKYTCDVSFVGQFYENGLAEVSKLFSPYVKGFLDALTETQSRVYGYNYLEELISDDLLVSINNSLLSHHVTERLTKTGLKQSMEKQITRTERILLLQLFGQSYNVHYYSAEQPSELKECAYEGCAYYYSEMPLIFRQSKINLCPTLRSIESGIPLRALDILGSKGVLLSNYQPELSEYFTDGADIIMYDSLEDAYCKVEYYLSHENERLKLIQNSYQIIKEKFNYPDRIHTLLQTAELLP